ncbi:hypothetical protein MC885_012272, partial [Smutsia gigantea]
MAVSPSISPTLSRAEPSPLFIRLISDPCCWVHQAAFQSVGPFISTFANPSRAGLYIREDGTLSIQPYTLVQQSWVQIEPNLPMEGTSPKTGNFLHISSSSNGLMGGLVEDSALARAEVPRLSPESRAFPRLPDINDLPTNSHPGLDPWACPGSPEDAFNNFLYWRTPLPDISKDLELLLSDAGLQEGCSRLR